VSTSGPGGGAAGDTEPTVPWRVVLDRVVAILTAAGGPAPELDARRLLEQVTGHRGTELAAHLDEPATRLGVARLDGLVERRRRGEPLQYVLGEWSFRTIDLYVDRRVLIPRPETEVVVGAALAELDRLGPAPTGRSCRALDLGTGSGAIALALVSERRDVEVVATDRSPDALAVARANLAGAGRPAARVTLYEGDWFDAVPAEWRGRVDLVVSNPPYVGAGEDLPAEVADWEPTGALVAGPTGTECLDHLVAEAPSWLARPGALVVELAPTQAATVVSRASAAGFDEVEVGVDLAGRDRYVVARLT
jgi:release factor glutamine methyltransferase